MPTRTYGQVLIGHEGRVMGADHIPAAVGGGRLSPKLAKSCKNRAGVQT